MKRYKRKFEEANYELEMRIINRNTIRFYQKGNDVGFPTYEIVFKAPVFGKDLYNKFDSIRTEKCKFTEVDAEFDAICNFTTSDYLIVTYDVDGNTIQRNFKIKKIVDAYCSIQI